MGNQELKGADRSVGSIAIEVRCALLTLSFLRPTLPMRDVDRKPYKRGDNVRLDYVTVDVDCQNKITDAQ